MLYGGGHSFCMTFNMSVCLLLNPIYKMRFYMFYRNSICLSGSQNQSERPVVEYLKAKNPVWWVTFPFYSFKEKEIWTLKGNKRDMKGSSSLLASHVLYLCRSFQPLQNKALGKYGFFFYVNQQEKKREIIPLLLIYSKGIFIRLKGLLKNFNR